METFHEQFDDVFGDVWPENRTKGVGVYATSAQALQDTWSLGLMLGDPELLASCYSPSGICIPAGGDAVQGAHRIANLWAEILSGGGRGNTAVTEEIEFSGDWMIERGVYARFPDPVAVGPPLERGNYTILHERQPDGRWLWACDLLEESAPYPRL